VSDHGSDKADREVVVQNNRFTRWAATLLAGLVTAGFTVFFTDYFATRDLVVVLHADHEPHANHRSKCEQVERVFDTRVSRLEDDCSQRTESLAELRGAFNSYEKRAHGGSP